MFIEHLHVGLKAAHDIFCRLNAIYSHNRLLIQQRTYFVGSTPARSTLYYTALLSNRNGDGIGTHLGTATMQPNFALFKINSRTIKQGTCSFKEVSRITLGLETNNIITHQTTVDGLRNIAG